MFGINLAPSNVSLTVPLSQNFSRHFGDIQSVQIFLFE